VDLYSARLRIFLRDFDLSEHDDIGTVDISSEELLRAADKEGVHWVSTTSQTNGQLLYVGVSVF